MGRYTGMYGPAGGKMQPAERSSPLRGFNRVLLFQETALHYEAHQPVMDDLEARITTIRDSL